MDGQLQPFYKRVQEKAAESCALREVLNMSSSLRVEAIESLGESTAPTRRCLL